MSGKTGLILRAGIALMLCPPFFLGPGLTGHGPVTTRLTWAREISRIVYSRCLPCHQPGGAAPMSFRTYAEVRPWAVAIREEVQERRMPPWSAVQGFGEFAHDTGLSQEEIHLISDWVEGGVPEGDRSLAPPIPSPPVPQPGKILRGITVRGRLRVAEPLRVARLQARQSVAGGSVRAVAELPGGAIVPLIWIYNYRANFPQVYHLRRPLELPRGTVLWVSPGGALVISD